MHYKSSSIASVCLIMSFFEVSVHTLSERRRDMDVVIEWSQLEFDYPSELERQKDINSGRFNVGKIVPMDVDVFNSENSTTVFISISRTIQTGVPASIGTVTEKKRNGNPIIKPYPSWSWHYNLEECRTDRIVSIYRMMVDECERLWLIDSGKIATSQTCPAQILAFDMKTNQLLYRYEIPSSLLQSNSLLVSIVVDVVDKADHCKNTFVYSADSQGFQLIVYDLMSNTSWAVRDSTFYPYPDYDVYTIAGESFHLMDGIIGMSLTPNKPSGENRRLFYHAMSSGTENWVYTAFLRNQTLFRDNPEAVPQIFHTYPNRRDTQSCAEAIDNNEILYYGLLGDIEIACFNTRGDYGSSKSTDIVGNNPVTMQLPSGMKSINNRAGYQELWTLTTRFQRLRTGSLNGEEINFRILVARVDTLISGTSCEYS